MRLLMILIISIVLIGCTTIDVIEVEKPFVAHPTLPSPIKPVIVNMDVISDNDKQFVIMTVRDMQKMKIYMADILRYIRSLKGVVCSYRIDLNEEYCEGYTTNDESNLF